MSHEIEHQILRLLHGELPAEQARDLERQIADDPKLAALHERYAAIWRGLELPPTPSPPGFATEVLSQLRRETAGGSVSWARAPAWARAGAAAALMLGVTLGAWIGPESMPPGADGEEQRVALLESPLSLAETYWLTLEENGTSSTEPEEE